MLRNTLFAALFAVAGSAHALSAGDIAFTAFNADEDGWSLVALSDIAAGTTIYFTDNEWQGSAFNTGESFHEWLTGDSDIAAGTVIRFSAIDSRSDLAASVGTFSRANVSGSSNYGISASAETLYAYLGSSATAATSFLAALSTGGFSSVDGALTGTGLAVGAGAVALNGGTDYAEYVGVRDGAASFADYAELLFDNTQWNNLGDGDFASLAPNTVGFTVAVPEPESYALLLAGLGLIGLATRRRRG